MGKHQKKQIKKAMSAFKPNSKSRAPAPIRKRNVEQAKSSKKLSLKALTSSNLSTLKKNRTSTSKSLNKCNKKSVKIQVDQTSSKPQSEQFLN